MTVSLPEMASTGMGVRVGLAVAKGVGVGSPPPAGTSASVGAVVGAGADADVAVGSGCTELLQATPTSNTKTTGMRNIARGLNHFPSNKIAPPGLFFCDEDLVD